MTMYAVDKVRNMGADLIVTVDTGSLCHAEIHQRSSLGLIRGDCEAAHEKEPLLCLVVTVV